MSYPPPGGPGTSKPNSRGPNMLPDYPGGQAYQRREADLARVRENQRRSRARRREYVMELENRLRQCELLGVEASTEVASAARRVTEENRRLRELLHAHGVDDRHIEHYVQNPSGTWDVSPGTIPPITGESPVQSLEQLLAPRRLSSLEPPALSVSVMPSQGSRENSAPSQSSSTSPTWQISSTSTDRTTPPASSTTWRNVEDSGSYAYPTPYGNSLSSPYFIPTSNSETSLPRAQRTDPPTQSRGLEEDDHQFSIQSLRIGENTKRGYPPPSNTYRGSDSCRSIRPET